MIRLYPKPGELENAECAAYFLTLRGIYEAQDRHGTIIARSYPSMDYLAIRAWSDRYAELRDAEKRCRAQIFGYRRRYAKPNDRRNARPALDDAIAVCSSGNAPGAGAGAPAPPTSAASKPERLSLRVVKGS